MVIPTPYIMATNTPYICKFVNIVDSITRTISREYVFGKDPPINYKSNKANHKREITYRFGDVVTQTQNQIEAAAAVSAVNSAGVKSPYRIQNSNHRIYTFTCSNQTNTQTIPNPPFKIPIRHYQHTSMPAGISYLIHVRDTINKDSKTLDTTPPMFLIYRYNNYTDTYDESPTYVMHTNAKTYDDRDITDIIKSINEADYNMAANIYSNQRAVNTRLVDNIF